ncbi:MAG: head GIN domain-containing protein [Nanoarchaeota archaeon]
MRILPLAILIITLCGCSYVTCVDGSGISKEESRGVAPFENVVLAGNGDIILSNGDEAALTLVADSNILPHLRSDVIDNTLTIYSTRCIHPRTALVAYVTAPVIHAATLAGQGNITSNDTLNSSDLTVTVSGSGDIAINVTADALISRITGSGNARITGVAICHNSIIAGSGTLDAGTLNTTNTSIVVTGSGTANVTATDYLSVKISGSGEVLYSGTPRVSQTITGTGSVTAR